ncbi:MAG TPA: hypothetical protein VN961_22270 [Streptosporangiaceae bacterium]|nr:hypothetical protein [Streptosporangiaceae bacterium]
MTMHLSRRKLLLDTLFGAGWLGLRSLATGIPLAILANPRKAAAQTAGCPANSNAQYILLSSSEAGDPLNANVPGMYLIPDIAHPPAVAMAPAQLTLLGRTWTAATPWARLPQALLDRTCFFHHGTYTVVHPDLANVMSLQGFVSQHEMLVSLLSTQLAGCLGTVQSQPIALGPRSASEGLTVGGRPQPILSPSALASLLSSPTGPLGQIQQIRDADLDRLNDWYRQNGNSAQRSFIDRYALSQQQARSVSESLLGSLAAIQDNSPNSQVAAALILFRMNVSPVVSIHIPFGGDNHTDQALANESKETVAGVATIGNLWTQLNAAGLQDRVTFATLNVFGRTLSAAKGNGAGRTHHGDHHVAVLIGKPFKGAVVGGVEPGGDDYRAMSIEALTGNGVAGGSGNVPFSETLSAMGKTLGVACGVSGPVLDASIRGGKVVAGALAG